MTQKDVAVATDRMIDLLTTNTSSKGGAWTSFDRVMLYLMNLLRSAEALLCAIASWLIFQALEVYRANFQPSGQLKRPHTMIGVNVIAAETDAEARSLATSQQMTFVDMFRGMPSLLKPPMDDIESYWTPREKAQTEQMLSCSVVGSAETVRAGLKQLVADTGADELMIVSDIFDFSQRVRSLEITAQAAT